MRQDCVDGALRTGAFVDRLCSDASVLRALIAAKTTPTVEHKRGADVNRLRSDVFVLRLVRRLTFELSPVFLRAPKPHTGQEPGSERGQRQVAKSI